MNQHVAMLVAALAQFDRQTFKARDLAAGVKVWYATRSGSKTEEGIAYAFDPAVFSMEAAKAWLERRGIQVTSFAPAGEMAQNPFDPRSDLTPPEKDTTRELPRKTDEEKEREGLLGRNRRLTWQETAALLLAGEDDRVDVEFEVLQPGTYRPKTGPVEITTADIQKIAETTNALMEAQQIKPPNKLGHDMDQEAVGKLFPEGGSPSLGWITKLVMRGSSLWAQATQVPRRFVELVQQGVWRTRSAEVEMNWQHPETKAIVSHVLTAVAWLGATKPAIGSLADIVGLESEPDGSVWLNADGVGLALGMEPQQMGTGDSGNPRDTGTTNDGQKGGKKEDSTKETTMTEEEKKALEDAKKTADAAKEAYIDQMFTLAVDQRRAVPADVEEEKPRVMRMSMEDAQAHMKTVLKRSEQEDLTKPKGDTKEVKPAGDGTKKDDKKDKELKPGTKKLLARTDEILKEKEWEPDKYEDALCLACEDDPESFEIYSREHHMLKAGEEGGGDE